MQTIYFPHFLFVHLAADEQKGSAGPRIQLDPLRFRPNLVITGGEPYDEDGWRSLKIRDKGFTVSSINLVGCTACAFRIMFSQSISSSFFILVKAERVLF